MIRGRMRGQGMRPSSMRPSSMRPSSMRFNNHNNIDSPGGNSFQYGRGRGFKHSVRRSPHNNGDHRSLSPVDRRMDPPRYRSRSPISSHRSFSPPSPHSARLRRNRPMEPPAVEPRRAPPQAQGGGRPRSPSVQSLTPPMGKQTRPGIFRGPWGTVLDRSDMKKITVDIKRHIPKEKRSSSPVIRRIINSDAITVYRRSGEGARPLFSRAELAVAVNQRFDKTPAVSQNEPRMVTIIHEPGSQQDMAPNMAPNRGDHMHPPMRMGGQRYSVQEGRGDGAHRYSAHNPIPKRMVANDRFGEVEDHVDRKFDQLHRYEQKFREESMVDQAPPRSGAGGSMRKMPDKDVKQRLGFRRPTKDDRLEPARGRGYDNYDMRAEGKQAMWNNDQGRHSSMEFRNRGRFGHSGFKNRGGRGRDHQQW